MSLQNLSKHYVTTNWVITMFQKVDRFSASSGVVLYFHPMFAGYQRPSHGKAHVVFYCLSLHSFVLPSEEVFCLCLGHLSYATHWYLLHTLLACVSPSLCPHKLSLFWDFWWTQLAKYSSLWSPRGKFLSLVRFLLNSSTADVKMLQHLSGKCILFSAAVPGAKLFINEINMAISKGNRSTHSVPVSGRLREEIQHWTFFETWGDFLL